MTPDEALRHSKALLQSTDALLGGLLEMAKQLRESVAVLQSALDQVELTRSVVKSAPHKHVPISTPTNGSLNLSELHEALKLAGFPLEKNTLNAYASMGQIPSFKRGKHRLFVFGDVLEALNNRPKSKRKHEANKKESTVPKPQTAVPVADRNLGTVVPQMHSS